VIQAIGLTSTPRGDLPPLVDDITFEARPGQVTGLLGDDAAAATALLRLMLELDPGRGVTLFDGQPLHRHAHPARQVGALLGDVPGHPGRTARSHLRMLAAANGVPAASAEQALEAVGLTGLADHRLGALSLGMDRRLGLATALLGEPRALLLDAPARDLSPRDTAWLHGLLKSYAAQGGSVIVTGIDPQAMTRLSDWIIALDGGRLTADQPAGDFARTRLRPYVAVHSPHAGRLAALLADDGAEVAASSGNRIAVYGTTPARIGETAYRNGILLHRLAEEAADTGPTAPLSRADGRQYPARDAVPPAGPARPLRYEIRRLSGVRTPWLIAAGTLLVSVACTLALLRSGHQAQLRVITGWPNLLPLPPAALGAGLLGALAYGQEFRYPALTPGRVPARHQLRLFTAKLMVSAAAALLLATMAGALGTGIGLLQGFHPVPATGYTGAQAAGWAALAVGCAWAGLLAAAVFRTTALGMAVVLAVPLLVAPALGGAHPAGQPVRQSLVLSLAALLCAYLATVLRSRDG
jgi:ABC-type multidrug transport system ATPase subunit